MDSRASASDLATLTAEIVKAHLLKNPLSPEEIPGLITDVYTALAESTATARTAAIATPSRQPAVPIRDSIKDDHLVCLECGEKVKVLKRHLAVHHNMTPEAYRQQWGLSADYPSIPLNFSEMRRNQALNSGLGKREHSPETVD